MPNNLNQSTHTERSVALAGLAPLNRGMERNCFVHPQEKNLVIKIPLPELSQTSTANLHEFRGYTLLRQEHGDLPIISHCHGFITTDLGEGLLCDCIRDDSGTVSRTLWQKLIDDEFCDILMLTDAVRKLCDYLLERRIWLFDLNPKNIAIRIRSKSTLQPFIIDLKGRYTNNEFLPVSRYVPYFARQKLKRRSARLIRSIADIRKHREELR